MSVEFTKEETAGLIQLLVGIIESHPFPHSPDIPRLRDILRKLRPMPELEVTLPKSRTMPKSRSTKLLSRRNRL